MAVGESPAVARHRLRLALREAREAKGLTQRQVARSLEWSMSKINRIEAGEVTVSHTDLLALLQLLGITDSDQVQELIEDARTSRRRGWWDQPDYREHLTPAMIQSLQFELDAQAIRSFQPVVIPGPLQTPDYARTILAGLGSDHIPEAVQAVRLEVRLRRREHLVSQLSPPKYLLVLDESVLLRQVGGARVMSEQLYDLLGVIRAGRVTVRISPLAPTASFAAFGLFTIYDSHDKDVALLYRESYETDEAVPDPENIRRHRRLFQQIWDQSLDVEPSTHLIEARAATLRSEADHSAPDG